MPDKILYVGCLLRKNLGDAEFLVLLDVSSETNRTLDTHHETKSRDTITGVSRREIVFELTSGPHADGYASQLLTTIGKQSEDSMNDHFRLSYGVLFIAFVSVLLMPPAFAGVQCYSRDSYSSNFISAIQKKLKTIGFYRGTVDGRWGSKTESALERFKSESRLTEPYTLGVDPRTLRALFGSGVDAESYGLSPNTNLPADIFATYCK